MSKPSVHINDSLVFRPLASAPANPEEGEIYYDSTLVALRQYVAGVWSTLGRSANSSYVFNGSTDLGPTVANNVRQTVPFGGTSPGTFTNMGWYNGTTGVLTAARACRMLISASILWNPNSAGSRALVLTKNGTDIFIDFKGAEPSLETQNKFCQLVDAQAGDYFELQIQQNSGSTLGLYLGALLNHLSIFEIP